MRTTRELPSIVLIVATASLIGFEVLGPMHAEAAGGRAAIETAITLSSLLTAALLAQRVSHGRHWRDLMLLGALAVVSLTDFVLSAVPALISSHAIESATGASLASDMIVAAGFAAAAFAPSGKAAGNSRRLVLRAGLAAIGTVALAELLEIVLGGHWAPSALGQAGPGLAAGYPVALAVNILAAAVLLVSGIAFFTRAGRPGREGAALAGASFLLAGARLQYVALPVTAADWVTPAGAMRLVAYGLLLVAALRRHAMRRREMAEAALNAERERIARDLHDGLAQDLAFIAAYGQRLQPELGPEHPLIVAAGRALAASRSALLDLSASTAPSTATALAQVANELATRFHTTVNVRVEQDGELADNPDLDAGDREEIVRIAREAILNAVRHGGARRVDVWLERRGAELLLRVSDDGCGISKGALRERHGFGLPTMRARAEALGGELTARPGAHGGTELAVVVPGGTARGGKALGGKARGDRRNRHRTAGVRSP